MKNFLSSLKGKRSSRERDRTPSEARSLPSPKPTSSRRGATSAAISATDAVLATARYMSERTPEKCLTPRPRAKSPSPLSEDSPGSPHPARPTFPSSNGRPGAPGELTESNVASVSGHSPWHQVSRPLTALRRWHCSLEAGHRLVPANAGHRVPSCSVHPAAIV